MLNEIHTEWLLATINDKDLTYNSIIENRKKLNKTNLSNLIDKHLTNQPCMGEITALLYRMNLIWNDLR